MRIIVTGSLGHISQPLVIELTRKGHSVTVISSNQDKIREIEALGVQAAIGSLNDPEFLASTLMGAEAAYVMVPPNLNVPDSRAYYKKVGHAYARAIEQSGVKRVVHLSSMGAELDKGTGLILGSHDVESILNQLDGVAVTHLRPSYFYTNLFSFMGMIKGLGFIGANYGGEDKIAMVDPRDIAVVAAEELLTTAATSKIRNIGGGDYTGNQAAAILGAAIGMPELKWYTSTDEQMAEGMTQMGMPPNIVSLFVEMGASIHSGILRQDYDRHPPLAMGKVKLEDFAREFAAAYKQ